MVTETAWQRSSAARRQTMSGAVGAHADEIVARINASSASGGRRDPGHGDRVADATRRGDFERMSSAIGAHADEIVGRIKASSAETVDAIRGHGDGVAAQLAEASTDDVQRRRRSRRRNRRPHQRQQRRRGRRDTGVRRRNRRTVGRSFVAQFPAPSALTSTKSSAESPPAARRPRMRSRSMKAQRRDNSSTSSLALSGAFGAHANDIVGRINASSEQALQAVRSTATRSHRVSRKPSTRWVARSSSMPTHSSGAWTRAARRPSRRSACMATPSLRACRGGRCGQFTGRLSRDSSGRDVADDARGPGRTRRGDRRPHHLQWSADGRNHPRRGRLGRRSTSAKRAMPSAATSGIAPSRCSSGWTPPPTRLSDAVLVHGADLVVRLNGASDRLLETVIERGEALREGLGKLERTRDGAFARSRSGCLGRS